MRRKLRGERRIHEHQHGCESVRAAISESPTMALNEQARVLREQGESVVHLGIGEPQNRGAAGGDRQRDRAR